MKEILKLLLNITKGVDPADSRTSGRVLAESQHVTIHKDSLYISVTPINFNSKYKKREKIVSR